MNNNKEKYYNSVDSLHASDELKRKTMKKIRQEAPIKNPFIRWASVAAVFVLVFSFGLLYMNKDNTIQSPIAEENPKEVQEIVELPKFANLDELKKVLEKNRETNMMAVKSADGYALATADAATESTNSSQEESFSRTNTQVENVDEADIVKTDGKYIYYSNYDKVYIVDSLSLEIVSEIKMKDEKTSFSPYDIYLNGDKLVIMGLFNEYNTKNDEERDDYGDRVYVNYTLRSNYSTMAIVFDIKDRSNPKEFRRVGIDGNYSQSRMIGDNLYFISNKYMYYYDAIKDEELLPIIETDGVKKQIPATDIVYFKDSPNMNYMMVAGFNINNKEEVNVETFFGSSGTVYASESNLYIAERNYWYNNDENTTIYKFSLKDSEVKLLCKGEVEGSLNNQFSMDEYQGNLRVATTRYDYNEGNEKTDNKLFVLNEEMNTIGKIENMAKGERIYSVRFIGNKGYIVTFEQVDPLFVIDLSDPKNPEIKGELKIPGYSSYLHPYDENHIIGIGYNTEDNGYGGQTNSTMKMSMFDVSDVTNPKELFNITIGDNYTYSEIINNHKSLFYNKEKNLIGFPASLAEESYNYNRSGFVIYKIDLESGFSDYCKILQEDRYGLGIQRAIYIGNNLYTISNDEINAYDLETFEEKGRLILKEKEEIIYNDYRQ